MSADDYFGKWLKVFDTGELYKVVNKLSLLNPEILCPDYKDIFKAFHICPYDNCKVVFLGQDPFPQKGVATGILFGNKKDTTNLSPSLEVIKESCINYKVPHGIIDFDITLESWAKQGILMLNSALTCEVNKIGSHTMLWRSFISKFLSKFSNAESGIIYVLFGTQAKTFKPYINSQYNHIIEVAHPSYYARINEGMPSSVFTEVNAILKKKYGTTIKWYQELNNLIINKNENQKIDSDDLFWSDLL